MTIQRTDNFYDKWTENIHSQEKANVNPVFPGQSHRSDLYQRLFLFSRFMIMIIVKLIVCKHMKTIS